MNASASTAQHSIDPVCAMQQRGMKTAPADSPSGDAHSSTQWSSLRIPMQQRETHSDIVHDEESF